MRNRCAIKPESGCNTGDQVYYYDNQNSGDEEYGLTHVAVYTSPEGLEWFLKCHISKILPLDENMAESKWGSIILKIRIFSSDKRLFYEEI